MKNLIFVISTCAFFSFSFISSDFFSTENKYLSSDLLFTENGFLGFQNPQDSSEPTDSSADTPPEVSSPLKDVSGMFNERGYFKSNSSSFDDQEIVNDFNGNLLYSVPMYSYALGGDMNLQMKLTYNGSVGHIITTSDTDRIRNQASVHSRRNVNFPEWIIDLNVFALQTFNFETNFFTSNVGANYVSGSSVNTIITGYHYDNELGLVNIDNHDKINILSGDGSIITLENVDYSGDSTNLYNYIGNYIFKGKEAYYKAIVSYIGTPSGQIAGNNPRKIILLKGDGLEYIFEEEKIHFDDFRTDQSLVNGKLRPIAIYLKEIRDRFSHSIKINYSPIHPFPIDPNEQLKGRQLLKSITTSGVSSVINNAAFWFEYGPSICKVFHQSELNGNYTIIYNTPVGYRSSDNYKNQRGTAGKITDILDQQSEFIYYTFLKRYDQMYALYYDEQSQYLNVSLNDLKRIEENIGLASGIGLEWLSGSKATRKNAEMLGKQLREFLGEGKNLIEPKKTLTKFGNIKEFGKEVRIGFDKIHRFQHIDIERNVVGKKFKDLKLQIKIENF